MSLSGPCQAPPEPVAMARFRDLSHVCRMHAASAGLAPLEGLAKNAPVAQLDRALDYESRGQEFESLRARHPFSDSFPSGTLSWPPHTREARSLEFRQIRYALSVAKERSFTKAAQRLNISQSAVSEQVKMLEEEAGFPIF